MSERVRSGWWVGEQVSERLHEITQRKGRMRVLSLTRHRGMRNLVLAFDDGAIIQNSS